jgi:tetratricopeptide (TPR) repeat protein
MTDFRESEAPFEILMLSDGPGRDLHPGRSRKPAPLGPIVRPERWLFVTHLLVLLALAGLAICIVGIVRLSRSAEGDASATPAHRVLLPEAAAAVVPEPVVPFVTEASVKKEEAAPPAPASRPAAEEPAPPPPPPAPPAAPKPEPVVESRVPAEPAPPPVRAEPPAPPAPPAPRPEEIEARTLLDEARALESENPALAAARYRKVLELLPQRTELWKTIADLDLGRGSLETAGRAYVEYLRSHPNRPDALQNLAVVEIRTGRLDEARVCLELAIKAGPNADLYYNLGNVHLKAQALEPAITAYRRALEYDPRHAEARFNLALALERAGRRAEAVSALSQLGTVWPEIARERARMEAIMGGLEADRALGLARASNDVEMVQSVAAGFRQAGEQEKALALLDRAIELAPRQAAARLNRGALRQEMGRLPDAVADYEEAIGLDPSLAEAHFNLGVLSEERGQYVIALNRYAAALKVSPAMACALNNVGALYLRVGQAEKALDWFQRCRAKDPDFAAARVNLAWAHLALGSKEQALAELKAYAQAVPKDKRNADAVRVLGELEAAAGGTAVRR